MRTMNKGARGWAFRALATGTAFLALASAAQAVTLKFWMHEHPPRLPLDQKIISEFEAANPDIKIDYQVIPDADFNTKLLAGFAAGSGPDVWNQLSVFVGQEHASGILAPLDFAATGVADQAALNARYSAGLDGITFDGKPYGLPTEVSNFMCFANDDLFAAAGLDASKDFPKTWEDLLPFAEKLTKRDAAGNPVERGFDFDWASPLYIWLTLNPMVTQLGGKMIDETAYTANLTSPEMKRVFSYWADLANNKKLGGPQYSESRTDFLAGKLAIDCSFGSWGIPQMDDAHIKWSIHPAPRWADAKHDNGNDNYAFYLMVNARSDAETQAAGWKFAAFYASHSLELFTVAGLFTPTPEVLQSPEFKAKAYMPIILDELTKGSFSPRIAGFNQVGDALARARDRIVQGGESVDDVLAAANDEVNGILKDEKAKAEASGQ